MFPQLQQVLVLPSPLRCYVGVCVGCISRSVDRLQGVDRGANGMSRDMRGCNCLTGSTGGRTGRSILTCFASSCMGIK